MFDVVCESIHSGHIQKYAVVQSNVPISFETLITLWQQDYDFRSFFLTILMDCPYKSYRFETPPVTQATCQNAFEFVLVDAPGLAPRPDARPFTRYFSTDERNDGIVSFENLGGDAQLIVPCPQAPESVYNHLANFVRGAPEAQKHSFLRRVGEAVQRRISDQPLWLNTAGGGVSWLHVRLDNRPKYYRFQPYKQY